MNYPVSLAPLAETDLEDAKHWYEERRKGLGEEFVFSIDATLNSISRNPLLFRVIKKGIRRALTKRFPFAVFFTIEKHEIIILAVLHCRRNPKLFLKRHH